MRIAEKFCSFLQVWIAGDVERAAATTGHVWSIGIVENRWEGETTGREGDWITPTLHVPLDWQVELAVTVDPAALSNLDTYKRLWMYDEFESSLVTRCDTQCGWEYLLCRG